MIIRHSMDFTGGHLIYLATPYSKWKDKDRAAGEAATWQARLAVKGFPCISPIVQGHAMGLDWPAEKWMTWCRPMFNACGCMVVPPIRGRDDSDGIQQEMQWADETNKPIIWILGPNWV